ncbi:hypothetical protein DXD76_05970 [Firmicutes bacterium TM09-10]|nr:hypothetical protein DXD76_05970 [Firmicutes bacterium TM09-10]
MQNGLPVFAQLVQMGKDCTICVWGGDTPHVGSVVMSTARPSLTGSGVGVTSSVLNGIGHKDEYVARKFAEAAAEKFVCTAVCSCGIHIDGITQAQLQEVSVVCDKLLKQVIAGA